MIRQSSFGWLGVGGVFIFDCALGLAGDVAMHPLFSYLLYGTSLLLLWYVAVGVRTNPVLFQHHALSVFFQIFLLALLVRLCFLGYPVSDDVNRYLWEGKVAPEINPYATAPNDVKQKFAHDPVFQGINHPGVSTAYPPFAMLVMRLVANVSYRLFSFKILALIADLILIVFLFFLTRLERIPPRYVLLYALNPLVLISGVGEAHIDVVHITLLGGALLSFRFQALYGKHARAAHVGGNVAGFLLLGLAVMTKFLSLLALPFLINRQNWRFAFCCFLPLLLYVPYIQPGMFEGLITFSGKMAYNDVLPKALRMMFDGVPYMVAMAAVCGLGLTVVWLFIQENLYLALLLAWGWCLLCLPCVHVWYLMPLVLFSVFIPRYSVWVWLLAMGLGFWVLAHQAEQGIWREFIWVWVLTYVPFLGVLLLEILAYLKPPPHPVYDFQLPTSLDIVIPVFNEGERLAQLLNHLEWVRDENSDCFETCFIVVDGGSTDGCCDGIEERKNVTSLTSSLGRGEQLAVGAEAGRGDLVLLLHADARPYKGALPYLKTVFRNSPHLGWGILGHRYTEKKTSFRFIEHFNLLKFYLFSLAFGDQGIYIRREVLTEVGGVPRFPLMEDVALSLRLQSFPRAKPGRFVAVSARRWHKKGYVSYFVEVVHKVMVFLLKRRLGCNMERVTMNMYCDYYAQSPLESKQVCANDDTVSGE